MLLNKLSLKPIYGRKEYIFYTIFFLPLLVGPAIAYVFMTVATSYYLLKEKKFTAWGIFFSMCAIFVLLYKFLQISDIAKWQDLSKFYLGWSLAYAYLYYSKTKIDIEKLILIFSIEVIVEGLLINTIIPTSSLRNYPHANEFDYGQIYIGEIFERVYSTGTNSSVSATLMCMLLTIRESLKRKELLVTSKKIDLLALIAMVLFNSGTGYMLFTLYFFYRFSVFRLKNLPIIFLFVIVVWIILDYFSNNTSSYELHFSWKYVTALIEDKIDRYKMYQPLFNNLEVYLFGINYSRYPALIWGDTAFLEFFVSFGIVGYVLLLWTVFTHVNKYNRWPIIIGLVGIWHYGGIFSLPGQMVFAYALLMNKTFVKQLVQDKNVVKK